MDTEVHGFRPALVKPLYYMFYNPIILTDSSVNISTTDTDHPVLIHSFIAICLSHFYTFMLLEYFYIWLLQNYLYNVVNVWFQSKIKTALQYIL